MTNCGSAHGGHIIRAASVRPWPKKLGSTCRERRAGHRPLHWLSLSITVARWCQRAPCHTRWTIAAAAIRQQLLLPQLQSPWRERHCLQALLAGSIWLLAVLYSAAVAPAGDADCALDDTAAAPPEHTMLSSAVSFDFTAEWLLMCRWLKTACQSVYISFAYCVADTAVTSPAGCSQSMAGCIRVFFLSFLLAVL